ncbi:MAG: cell division protein ZapA [Leptospiraceae bacterium]|nr:cell division protein ZapA [Leptospiraceae bacterium]|tara:strand:+ start:262 stop:588 length:327 start_codon:yes stop_codon:yes gene_type:complete
MTTATAQKVARTTVDIFGEKYVVRGDESVDYIADVARLVDDRMRELARNSRGMSRSRLAILAALNLADELMQERSNPGKKGPEDELLAQKTRYMITLLDEGLAGDSIY